MQDKLDLLHSKLAVLAQENPASTPSSSNTKTIFTKLTNQEDYLDWRNSYPVLAGVSISPFRHLVTINKKDYYIPNPTLTHNENKDLDAITFHALKKLPVPPSLLEILISLKRITVS